MRNITDILKNPEVIEYFFKKTKECEIHLTNFKAIVDPSVFTGVILNVVKFYLDKDRSICIDLLEHLQDHKQILDTILKVFGDFLKYFRKNLSDKNAYTIDKLLIKEIEASKAYLKKISHKNKVFDFFREFQEYLYFANYLIQWLDYF